MDRNKCLAHPSRPRAAVYCMYCTSNTACILLQLAYYVVFIVLDWLYLTSVHLFYLLYLHYILSGDYLAPHRCQISILYCAEVLEDAILSYCLRVYGQNDNTALSYSYYFMDGETYDLYLILCLYCFGIVLGSSKANALCFFFHSVIVSI